MRVKMNNQFSTYRTNGNTAYQPERKLYSPQPGRVIAFPGNPTAVSNTQTALPLRTQAPAQHYANSPQNARGGMSRHAAHNRFAHVLSTSEMFCSLKYESLAGVKHNVFTKSQMVLCFTVCVAIAAIALVAGC